MCIPTVSVLLWIPLPPLLVCYDASSPPFSFSLALYLLSMCFFVYITDHIVDTPPILERDPHSIENFNLLQEFVDEYLADAERVMEKRIRYLYIIFTCYSRDLVLYGC